MLETNDFQQVERIYFLERVKGQSNLYSVDSYKLYENDGLKVTSKELIEDKSEFGYKIYNVTYEGYGEDMKMEIAFNLNDDYIGEVSTAKNLCEERGIRPEVIDEDCNVCSIGKSVDDGKWYGWSHRAIYGFEIGDVVSEGDVTSWELPIGFRAKSEEDAKRMAIVFANGVA